MPNPRPLRPRSPADAHHDGRKTARRQRVRHTSFGISSPSEISGLVAWYDFSDVTSLWQDASRTSAITADGQEILGVTDKASTNHLSALASSGAVYKTGIFNGKSIGRFDGANDALRALGDGPTTAQPLTIIAVVKADNATIATTSDGIVSGEDFQPALYMDVTADTWAYYAGTARVSATAVDTSLHILSGVFSGASSVLRLDGVSINTDNPGTGGFNDAEHRGAIGSFSGATGAPEQYWDGDIGEILIYDSALSNANLNALGSLLATKWGLTWTSA